MTNDAPDRDAALTAAEMWRNDAICLRFEADWRAQATRHPRIEAYLEDASVPARSALIDDLLRLEVELASEGRPRRCDYRARFPGHEAAIEALPLGEEDRYELIEEVGRGAMGVVYRAVQAGPAGMVVALKMIHPDLLGSRDAIERFLAEAREQARFRHAGIVPVLDSGERQGQPFFVMEYIPGPTLADRLGRGGPFDPGDAARTALGIAEALAFLHDVGRVHRDLKPANILLDAAGRPLVADFGLVKALGADRRDAPRMVVGTASYMAPEQAEGRDEDVGPASDLYSLGAILYESLTGRPPLLGRTLPETLDQVIRGEPRALRVLRPGLPCELEWVCLKCLAKSPAHRYRSATEVADDLRHFLAGEPLEHTPAPGRWQRLRRWARRKPALATRLGVIAACLAVIWSEGPLRRSGLSLLPEGFEEYLIFSWSPLAPYWINTTLLLLWAGSCWAFQGVIDRIPRLHWLRPSWVLADVAVLTSLLALNHAFLTPLVVAYPTLVAVSGLWLDVRAVAITTAVAITGYLTLLLPRLMDGPVPLYLHLHFVTAMVTTGLITAHQVRRIGALGRLCEPWKHPGSLVGDDSN